MGLSHPSVNNIHHNNEKYLDEKTVINLKHIKRSISPISENKNESQNSDRAEVVNENDT